MPTLTHEAPLELIRQCPDLAVDLLRAMADVPLPADLKAELRLNSLNAVVPAEFTADAVVVVKDRTTDQPMLVIVVEPQGRDDPTKVYSWPVYLSIARESVTCPSAVLLVICPDPREAEKCRRVIKMGHPGWDLYPIVIDPTHAPDDTGAGPYLILFLAILPALDMTNKATRNRVLGAIVDTGASEADRRRLTAIILNRATDAARKLLEAEMATDEWKNDYIESYVNVGIEQGDQRGAARTRAQDILEVIDARDLKPTPEQRAKVTPDAGLDKLTRWFGRALTAATAADIFRDDD